MMGRVITLACVVLVPPRGPSTGLPYTTSTYPPTNIPALMPVLLPIYQPIHMRLNRFIPWYGLFLVKRALFCVGFRPCYSIQKKNISRPSWYLSPCSNTCPRLHNRSPLEPIALLGRLHGSVIAPKPTSINVTRMLPQVTTEGGDKPSAW